jgi:hypothetical protein
LKFLLQLLEGRTRFNMGELEEGIKNVLFNIAKELTIHELDESNAIIEINYDKYTVEIMELFKKYLEGR